MNNKSKHFTLYVLKLEQGKYYVGITSQTPDERFQEHLNGSRKSWWTNKFKPIAILDTVDLGELSLEEAKAYENRVTRRYMRERGVNNVRGGDLTMTSDLVVRFGRYILDKDLHDATLVMAVQTIVILILTIALIRK